MDSVFLILAIVALVLWAPNAVEMAIGLGLAPKLRRQEPLPDRECPLLSIIVPACNEGSTVEPAMRSLLALDYPHLEVVAVNDRSTDETGEILARLSEEDARLRVIQIDELPAGWLGKNHALQRGSEAAAGEWLLFTDADVVYRPDALRRAMGLVREWRCDHLVALPLLILKGFWERSFVPFFMTMFNCRFRTWQASWGWAPGYVGVGAFNMVRAAVYRELGGHEALRLEVADDIKLGKLIKRKGYRQCLARAEDLIQVRWVVGLQGAVGGLTKNAFAGVGYSWLSAIGSSAFVLVATAWPLLGLFLGSPLPRLCCLAALASMLLAGYSLRPDTRVSALYALTWPLAAVLFVYIIIRSGLLAERQGGIYWRGTFYPLEELRRNRC
jgi:glycosyl transferase family 2